MIDQLHGVALLLKIALRSTCHQLSIRALYDPKTTVFTMYCHYEFLVIFFELNNAHVGFRELMKKVFCPYLDFFIVSFDEI